MASKNLDKDFTHLSKNEHPNMVDVSEKSITKRTAIAQSTVYLGDELAGILNTTGKTKKGPVFHTAVIAGIQAAKKTSELIPMCHPIYISSVGIDIKLVDNKAVIQATVSTNSQTGVEMEALTAVSASALTLYDMCKSISKAMVIESTFLIKKTGGKSGDFIHPDTAL